MLMIYGALFKIRKQHCYNFNEVIMRMTEFGTILTLFYVKC